MMKKIMFVLFLMGSMLSYAQFGVNGGVSVLSAFGVPKPYVGFHLGGEVPRDDQVSFFGKISFYARQKETTENLTYVQAIDPSTTPTFMDLKYVNSMNYTIIEGGNRYYIGDGYDSGFGAYGSGNVAFIFNTVKRRYEDYDESKYTFYDPNELPKGTIFSFGAGLSAGIKHTLAGVGTFYLDASGILLIYGMASNVTASGASLYKPLLFTFNIGYRRDFY